MAYKQNNNPLKKNGEVLEFFAGRNEGGLQNTSLKARQAILTNRIKKLSQSGEVSKQYGAKINKLRKKKTGLEQKQIKVTERRKKNQKARGARNLALIGGVAALGTKRDEGTPRVNYKRTHLAPGLQTDEEIKTALTSRFSHSGGRELDTGSNFSIQNYNSETGRLDYSNTPQFKDTGEYLYGMNKGKLRFSPKIAVDRVKKATKFIKGKL
jgi:hypothetical protein